MLIIPKLKSDNSLFLDAYSFQNSEIQSLQYVLNSNMLEWSLENISKDSEGRFGVRHILDDQNSRMFQSRLNVIFVKVEDDTIIEFGKDREKQNFRCEKISLYDKVHDCITITAENNEEALVKCALVAKNNNWFGSSAKVGICEKKGFWKRIF